MTGLPEYNYPAFRQASKTLRDLGHFVFDPSEAFDGATDLPKEVVPTEDIPINIGLGRNGDKKKMVNMTREQLTQNIIKTIGENIFASPIPVIYVIQLFHVVAVQYINIKGV